VRHLICDTGGEPSRERLRTLLAAKTDAAGFWLDIEKPSGEDLEMLEQVFKFHPLTIEDVRNRDQRPKIEEFDGYDFIVLFSAVAEGDGIAVREHHLYLSERFVVSVHNQPSPELDELRKRVDEAPELLKRGHPFLFYLVVDKIVDSLFPILDDLDDETDSIEDGIIDDPTPTSLGRIQQMKHDIVDLRKILGAQRDVFQSLSTHSIGEHDEELRLYFRDVYDHIIRQYETVDSLRDLLAGATDVYLSTVSNRLNDVMKRLTIIATLFMPLTFVTGFLGMNLAWMTDRIEGFTAFALSVICMALIAAGQFLYFRRKSWI
jgi:magnesium transporter